MFSIFVYRFQIGKKSKCCSAIKVGQSEILSENEYEYWYSGEFIEGRINKNSTLGKTITKMISSKKTDEKIEKVILSKITLKGDKVAIMLHDAKLNGYQQGISDQQEKVKEVLGIH